MKLKRFTIFAGSALAFLFLAGMDTGLSAQGRPPGAGPPAGVPRGGPPGGIPGGGVDRGLGTASERSGGRSDIGLGRASDSSMGRSDQGLMHSRTGTGNGQIPGDRDLNRYRGIANRFNTTPEELRARFEVAVTANPNLNFGLFVAAHVVADNLNSQYPNVTTENILRGLRNGDSFGRTLENLGVDGDDADNARKDANRRIKESRKRP